MIPMPKAVIFCRASFARGMGHLMRQIHIAKELRSRGFEVSFCVSRFSAAEKILKENNFPHSAVSNIASPPRFKTEKAGLTILDVQDTTLPFVQSLKARSGKIVSFEDRGEGRNRADLLIDCNLGAGDAKNVKPETKTLFGPPYSVLAPGFEKFHQEKRSLPDQVHSLLITFGGTDPHNITPELAKRVPNKIKTTIILGPGFQNRKSLRELNKSPFSVRENVRDMAPLLASHDAVFCSGGVTLHEAMCAGTPAFVISQAAHQEDKAKAAEGQGAAVNLGRANSWNTRRVEEIFNLAPKTLQAMSDAGKKRIDGKGLKRVVEGMLSICQLSSSFTRKLLN